MYLDAPCDNQQGVQRLLSPIFSILLRDLAISVVPSFSYLKKQSRSTTPERKIEFNALFSTFLFDGVTNSYNWNHLTVFEECS